MTSPAVRTTVPASFKKLAAPWILHEENRAAYSPERETKQRPSCLTGNSSYILISILDIVNRIAQAGTWHPADRHYV